MQTRQRAYIYAGIVQLGKFSAVVADTTTFAQEGFSLPAGLNSANFLGIVEEGIVPNLATDYQRGSYEGFSQAVWPLNSLPNTPAGIKRSVVFFGPCRARAAGAWRRGDRLIIANSTGQLASVKTLALPVGTAINVVGYADEPATNPGDIAQIIVIPDAGAVVVADPAGGVA